MPTKRHQDLLDLRHPTDKKASKPLMEKRRRARINHSLAQLKALVIDPSTTERSRQAKLEKADILELTVRHLHDIKRQQRTALSLEDRHPKKKFEIGYSECAREVELFLSNLMSLDVDVRQRLKDHLNRRLQDFSPKKDVSDEDEPSPSSDCLPTDTEDSSDSSALNKMLRCYAEKGTAEVDSPPEVDFRPKRLKRIHSKLMEEDHFLCHSVTSTTGCKPSEEPAQRSERHLRVVGPTDATETYPPRKCLDRRSEVVHFTNPPSVTSPKDRQTSLQQQTTVDSHYSGCISPTRFKDENRNPHSPRVISAKHAEDRQTFVSTSLQQQTTVDSYHSGCISPSSSKDEDRNRQSPSNSAPTKQNADHRVIRSRPKVHYKQTNADQIPLEPRQLANGDWALVLPASLVPTAKEESHPFSAFRLVVPSRPEMDADLLNKQRPHSSSSSTVSDISCEEYCSRSDGDQSSPDSSTQVVWRPW